MLESIDYARVIGCERCAVTGKLLRDEVENVPQPGFVGRDYLKTGVLLVGQNPGVPPPHLAARDAVYTRALRALRDQPTDETLQAATRVTREFVPQWPIHGAYFPLSECGLTLDEIAYFNVVRCRTVGNAAPSSTMVLNCLDAHFARWLHALTPRVVIFIGKWPKDRGATLVKEAVVPYDFINRSRSLSSQERRADRVRVAALVRSLKGPVSA